MMKPLRVSCVRLLSTALLVSSLCYPAQVPDDAEKCAQLLYETAMSTGNKMGRRSALITGLLALGTIGSEVARRLAFVPKVIFVTKETFRERVRRSELEKSIVLATWLKAGPANLEERKLFFEAVGTRFEQADIFGSRMPFYQIRDFLGGAVVYTAGELSIQESCILLGDIIESSKQLKSVSAQIFSRMERPGYFEEMFGELPAAKSAQVELEIYRKALEPIETKLTLKLADLGNQEVLQEKLSEAIVDGAMKKIDKALLALTNRDAFRCFLAAYTKEWIAVMEKQGTSTEMLQVMRYLPPVFLEKDPTPHMEEILRLNTDYVVAEAMSALVPAVKAATATRRHIILVLDETWDEAARRKLADSMELEFVN